MPNKPSQKLILQTALASWDCQQVWTACVHGSPGPADRLPLPALLTCHLLCLGQSPRLGREEFPWLVRKKRTFETLDKGDHCRSPLDFSCLCSERPARQTDGFASKHRNQTCHKLMERERCVCSAPDHSPTPLTPPLRHHPVFAFIEIEASIHQKPTVLLCFCFKESFPKVTSGASRQTQQ